MNSIDLFLWALFLVLVSSALAIDLFVVNRHAHTVSIKEAVRWVIIWVSLALAFNVVVLLGKGPHKALEFLTGYVIEYSLSVDNLFVFLMIFAHFSVKQEYQPRILKWGILGAVFMRAVFVMVGVTLMNLFHWMVYVFGALLIYGGMKMLAHQEEEFDPEKNAILRLFRFFIPVSSQVQGESFFVKESHHWMATSLLVVLIVIEASDLIFALDSVPAVIAISRDLFIVYSSNIFAILGLRSLYFLLAGVMNLFQYLKYGLCIILSFVGLKLMISHYYHIPVGLTLGLIALILSISIIASLLAGKKKSA